MVNSDNGVKGIAFGPVYGSSEPQQGLGFDATTGAPYIKDTANVTQLGVTTLGVQTYAAGVATGYLPGNLDSGRIMFERTVTITSAAAGTAVSIVADSEVPAGKKCYVLGFRGQVAGGTLWATTATVKVQDTNGTPVDFITVAVAAMTANANIFANTANVTPENAYMRNTGGTAAKGVRLKGNANGTGSDFIVTVYGYIA
jgi:hypothetical protein